MVKVQGTKMSESHKRKCTTKTSIQTPVITGKKQRKWKKAETDAVLNYMINCVQKGIIVEVNENDCRQKIYKI